ncbi:carotenoid biosynthesis protein [bacterium]|nr:MAG: carotenoid biosynthesis protein [bacterium]
MRFSPRGTLWLWLGALFLFLNGFFVAKVPDATRPELANVSAAFVLVLYAPSAWALSRWLGRNRAIVTLAALGAFAVAIETFAVKTGYPYGSFEYGPKIGAKVFDAVPWTVPFSWPPLVLGAFALARGFAKNAFALFVLSTLLLLVFDLLLDPGAVSQQFWTYQQGGAYYGVPFSNFCGWLLSGFIGSWMLWQFSGKRNDVPPLLVSSVTLILAFWTSVCLFSGLVVPTVAGILALALCARASLSKSPLAKG